MMNVNKNVPVSVMQFPFVPTQTCWYFPLIGRQPQTDSWSNCGGYLLNSRQRLIPLPKCTQHCDCFFYFISGRRNEPYWTVSVAVPSICKIFGIFPTIKSAGYAREAPYVSVTVYTSVGHHRVILCRRICRLFVLHDNRNTSFQDFSNSATRAYNGF